MDEYILIDLTVYTYYMCTMITVMLSPICPIVLYYCWIIFVTTVKPVLRDHSAKRSPSDLRPLAYAQNTVI